MARAPSVPIGKTRPMSAIWGQSTVPVLARPETTPPLFVRLPFASDNRAWLQECGRKNPVLVRGPKTGRIHWEIPMAWFSPLIRRCLERYGRVYVIQPLDRSEVCARSCWEARGDICECSCIGTNHGGGEPDGAWKEVSEAFAVRREKGELSCRMLVRSSAAVSHPS